ncbi:hypothetical protein DYB32_004018 [Aphanomyces invadans]|uniref:J domain-containing protein n=1 Tax=Aphanomyces invadans TaxID=157072 RepID=A0A3R6Z060_9STRA|nr:hypothetical protein DYB32_004018 [Aphanomyces invadans]
MGRATALWCSTGVTEEQVGNAAVLCAAIASDDILTFLESDPSTATLSDDLALPSLLRFDDFVLIESELSVFCCIKPTPFPQQLLDITERQATFWYGGRVHTAFHKQAKRILQLLRRPHDPLTRQSLLDIVHGKGKTLVLCGHAATGSTAHMCFLGLVYASLPRALQLTLEAIDDARMRESNASTSRACPPSLLAQRDLLLTEIPTQDIGVRSIAFGSPCIATSEVSIVLASTKLAPHMVTIVNEFDCVPNIFDIAQTASLVSTTTSRFVEVSRALGFVLKLLPTVSRVVSTAPVTAASSPMAQFALSYYADQTWHLVHKTFRTFQTRIIHNAKWTACMQDLRPVGTYAFLTKDSLSVTHVDDSTVVAVKLRKAMQAVSTFALRQHVMPSYVMQVSKRVAQGCTVEMNHYERLHIAPDATVKEVRAAYKSHALKWHPDRWTTPADRDKATIHFKLLAEAHEVLTDPDARAAYDKQLQQQADNHAKGTWGDEFLQRGTVHGTSLDDALRVFRLAQDKWNTMTWGFSNSNGVLVVPKSNPRFNPNNHDNLFAVDKMRVVRADKSVTYVASDDMLATDQAATTHPSSGSFAMAASAVGGAVVVSAGMAVAVHAWTKYNDNTRRRRQAEAVRRMPFPLLQQLLMDKGSHGTALARGGGGDVRLSHQRQLVQPNDAVVAAHAPPSQHTTLMDEFYDCLDDVGWATTQEQAEDEFFECLATLEGVDLSVKAALYPNGAFVSTPFGVGTVIDRREVPVAHYVVALPMGCLSYVDADQVDRGAAAMLSYKEHQLDMLRSRLADQVVVAYGLQTSSNDGATLGSMVSAGQCAAVDSGVKAASGVALATGLRRVIPGLRGVAAPLTVAAILVDIGKDYLEFRQKKPRTSASERLSMQAFWLKAGHHVASGTVAAAGATLGLYGVATTVGYWTGAAAMGPVGLVAATGGAVVGSVLGYAAGASMYASSTKEHFSSLQQATAEIDRLEVGAKVLFTQYDPDATGQISKADCKLLIRQVFANEGDPGYVQAVTTFDSTDEDSVVPWAVFWEWVSTEAIEKLDAMEKARHVDNVEPAHRASWWLHYQRYFNFANVPPTLARPCDAIYPSVLTVLAFKPRQPIETEQADDNPRACLIELAQVDALVESDRLSCDEAYCLKLYMQSTDNATRNHARRTIRTLQREWAHENHGMISTAFEAGSDETHADEVEQLDVLCSLLSHRALGRLLVDNHVRVPPNPSHSQLHGLALTHLTPLVTSP